tara:strand:- start:421 stop:633 length:213 start_codon:yes stop_codon:yes gene_type:complete
MELLYTKEKDYLMDAQLETTECEKCGVDIDPMHSYIMKVKNSGYPNANGFIFVCASCKNKQIYDLRKELL